MSLELLQDVLVYSRGGTYSQLTTRKTLRHRAPCFVNARCRSSNSFLLAKHGALPLKHLPKL